MSNSSSSATSRYRGQHITSDVICCCGAPTVIRTSWFERNLGRRFYCCTSKCGFVTWFDQELCPRASQVISGLIRSKNRAEERNKEVEVAANARDKEVMKWKLVAAAIEDLNIDVEIAIVEDNFAQQQEIMVAQKEEHYEDEEDSYDLEILKDAWTYDMDYFIPLENVDVCQEHVYQEQYENETQTYDPKVLNDAWNYHLPKPEEPYFNPYEDEEDSDWSNDDYRWK